MMKILKERESTDIVFRQEAEDIFNKIQKEISIKTL